LSAVTNSVEARGLCCIEQSAVREPVSSAFNGFNNDVAPESVAGVLWSNSMSIDGLDELLQRMGTKPRLGRLKMKTFSYFAGLDSGLLR
jgi:hypothetical protein